MENLLTWYESFIKLSQSNPMIAGFVGLYIAGITGWLLKDLPARIKNFIIREGFTSLYIIERGESWSEFDEKQQFKNFFTWVERYNINNLSRIFTLNRNKDIWSLVPGIGINFFIYKKRLFWYKLNIVQGSGQTLHGIKYEVVITTYGRNKKIFEDIFEEFKNIHETIENSDKQIRLVDGSDWWEIQKIPKKDLDLVFMNNETKNELLETFDYFYKQVEICKKLQTPHRITILLEGPTGTGKTTIIKALANKLNKHIYLMSPVDLLKSNLARNLARWGEDGIIVVEDVDSLSTIKSRGDFVDEDKEFINNIGSHQTSGKLKPLAEKTDNEKKDQMMTDLYDFFGGGLSSVLNNLDGVIEYESTIIIMTTNDASSIDRAMLRPGRIDKIIHIGWLNKNTIIDCIRKFYSLDESKINLENQILIEKLSGAKLSNILKFSKNLNETIDKINECA